MCFSMPVRVCGFVLESEFGVGGLSWRVQRRRGGVWPVAGGIDWGDLSAFFDFRGELRPPDAALLFASAFGGGILLSIVVGVPRFGGDGARRCVVVEAGGCVGACLWVACEPVAGGIPVVPSRAASCVVDCLHGALFNVWGGGCCVGGVFVGEVTRGVFSPVFSFGWSCCFVCFF